MDIVVPLVQAAAAAVGIVVILVAVYAGYVVYRAIKTASQVGADLSNVVVLHEWREARA